MSIAHKPGSPKEEERLAAILATRVMSTRWAGGRHAAGPGARLGQDTSAGGPPSGSGPGPPPRPDQQQPATPAPDPADERQPAITRGGSQRPRVLVVDDSPVIRRVLRGLLEDAGIPVVGEAVNGAHGVELAVTLRPDVVLMDWRMPHLDGLQATARIRQQLPTVQVVMFSSAEGASSGILAQQAGASAFVAKGAPPEQLCAAVLAAWRLPPTGPHNDQRTER
jgi:CheY-like chemotaxis protein